jgi:hypothetical protein
LSRQLLQTQNQRQLQESRKSQQPNNFSEIIQSKKPAERDRLFCLQDNYVINYVIISKEKKNRRGRKMLCHAAVSGELMR